MPASAAPTDAGLALVIAAAVRSRQARCRCEGARRSRLVATARGRRGHARVLARSRPWTCGWWRVAGWSLVELGGDAASVVRCRPALLPADHGRRDAQAGRRLRRSHGGLNAGRRVMSDPADTPAGRPRHQALCSRQVEAHIDGADTGGQAVVERKRRSAPSPHCDRRPMARSWQGELELYPGRRRPSALTRGDRRDAGGSECRADRLRRRARMS